ncbi:MAG: murein biosynthesis integral membrane protein MurJ [Hydrogenophilaceae bacterium]|jgi:putative peptidoglycan lipid II flippase|nr:murein biosynthesis integral membrane protein MurJ [Hydrogenophilaceae bacterium]
MSLARNTAVIGGLTLISRVLGFARDLLIAAAMGAGPVADAFFAALRFPNLFRRLFAEGAFSQAFVPVYAKTLAEKGPEEADRMANEALAVLLVITAALTAIAVAAMPWINLVLFAGYVDDPQAFRLATLLTQLTMPYLMAMSVATLFSGVLNARGKFFVAAAAPILLNLCLLVGVWPFQRDAVQAAIAAAVSVSVSGVLQAAWVWAGAQRAGAHGAIKAPRITANVKRIAALAVPGAIAGGALQINVMVSQILASYEEGAIAFLNVADRLYQMPLGLIGIAVGVAMLPRLSRLVQEGDAPGAKAALDDAVALSMAFTLPAAAAMLAIPFFIIDGLFSRGAFTADDARNTALALTHYGWGVPAFVLARVYAPAFFAREDTRAPMRYAIVSMALNIGLGAALFFGLRALGVAGFPGLAIATSAAAWLNVGLMIRSLSKRNAYGPTRAAYARLARVGLASGTLFLLLFLAGSQRATLEALLGGKEMAIAAVIGVGGVVYFVCAFLFRAVTISEVRAAFRRERGPAGAGSGGLPGGFDG